MVVPLLLGALSLLPSLATAFPAGSKHVVYLATCTPTECPIGICDPDDFNLIGAGYFKNGPPTSATSASSTFGTLSTFGSGPSTWEGTKRSVRLGSDGTFSSQIDKGAKTQEKSKLVGSGTLAGSGNEAASEPFVCFRDGTTKFRATYEGDRYSCTADYYCPSTDVGTTPPGQ